MSDDGDHPALDGYSIDEDYIGSHSRLEPADADVNEDQGEDTDEVLYRHRDASDAAESDMSDTHGDLENIAPEAVGEANSLDDADRSAVEGSRGWRFGRGAGTLSASSLDELKDESGIVVNDGRSYTRTMFYPWEAGDADTHMSRRGRALAKLNDGYRSRERRSQNAEARLTRTLDILCGHIETTPYQRERAETIADSVNMAHMGPYTTETIVLAAVSLACNEDGRWVRDEANFRGAVEDVDATLRDIRLCRNLFREKSEVL